MDRGVVLNELERFGVEEIALDEPGPGEARVRIEASGVCHSDLHVVRTGFNHPMPVLLGHEGAGVVEAVGEGVEHVGPGDRVVIGWRAPCGECAWCLRGASHLCRTPAMAARRMHTRDGRDLMGAMRAGTFATRTVVHAASLVALPDGLSAEEACLIGCAVATGVCSVLKTAEVWEGARVGVIGCGAVGLSVIQGRELPERRRSTRSTWTTGSSRPLAASGRRTRARRSVSTSSSTSSGARDRRARAADARARGDAGLHRPPAARGRRRSCRSTARSTGGSGSSSRTAATMSRRRTSRCCWAMAADGRFDLAGMVTKRIELDGVEVAFEDMEAGEVIRSVIVL